jgi:hypothetical protein
MNHSNAEHERAVAQAVKDIVAEPLAQLTALVKELDDRVEKIERNHELEAESYELQREHYRLMACSVSHGLDVSVPSRTQGEHGKG